MKKKQNKTKHPEASASAPRRRFFTPNLSHGVDLPSCALFERAPSIIGREKTKSYFMKGSNQIKKEKKKNAGCLQRNAAEGEISANSCARRDEPPLSLDGEESRGEKITTGINDVNVGSRLDA